MELQKDYYLKLLYTLKPTEEHMKSLAIYTRTFGGDCDLIVGCIEHVWSQSSIHHRLALYYLINEVLMTERSTSRLRHVLRDFVRAHFQADSLIAARFDVLYEKFVELEKVWRSKRVVDFDEKYTLEDVLYGVKETFQDRKAFLEFICALKEYYERKED